MLHRAKQQHVRYIGEFLAHDFLRFDDIRRNAGDRSLVANRASEHNINLMDYTGMHDAAGQDSFLHRRCDSA